MTARMINSPCRAGRQFESSPATAYYKAVHWFNRSYKQIREQTIKHDTTALSHILSDPSVTLIHFTTTYWITLVSYNIKCPNGRHIRILQDTNRAEAGGKPLMTKKHLSTRLLQFSTRTILLIRESDPIWLVWVQSAPRYCLTGIRKSNTFRARKSLLKCHIFCTVMPLVSGRTWSFCNSPRAIQVEIHYRTSRATPQTTNGPVAGLMVTLTKLRIS
jgi:hypothetical protein